MRTTQSAIVRIAELQQLLETALIDIYKLLPQHTSSQLQTYLSPLRDDLSVYVEYPYVDKVYRSSYYTYFSTKHREYNRDCIRVSLFEGQIQKEHFRKTEFAEMLQKTFRGFFIVRPTRVCIVGRSMISPRALKSSNFCCCLVETNAMVNGCKLSVEAFPYSSQDTETISCAETTIWGVMEYFGNRYPEYKPVLPAEIIGVLSTFSYERQIPTHGLTAEQIAYSLKAFGFGVRVYAREIHKDDLKRIFNYYVESGIPFVCVLKNNEIGHGVVVMGRENWSARAFPTGTPSETIRAQSRMVEVYDTADIPSRYLSMDDNYPPYQLADYDNPTAYYSDPRFQNCTVQGIIVPLYQKVYLEALQARQLVFNILKSDICVSISGTISLRLQLTSSRSFKAVVASNSSIAESVRDLILSTDMAKFVWVAELSNPTLFSVRKAFALVLLDATEANENSIDALLVMFYSNSMITLNDKQEFEVASVPFSEFDIYSNNLRGGF